jgi:hypothetical protein
MDALQQQLVEALILARLALDHVAAVPVNRVEIDRAKALAEAAIQAAIRNALDRALLRDEDNTEEGALQPSNPHRA